MKERGGERRTFCRDITASHTSKTFKKESLYSRIFQPGAATADSATNALRSHIALMCDGLFANTYLSVIIPLVSLLR